MRYFSVMVIVSILKVVVCLRYGFENKFGVEVTSSIFSYI